MLLRLKRSDGIRWALVAGVELELKRGRETGVRAWLLLDSALPAPWATGYNARLELRPAAQACVYRGLDGELDSVEIAGFIELTPRLSARAGAA